MTNRTRISASGTIAAVAAIGVLLLSGCSSPANGHWSNTSGPSGPGATGGSPGATGPTQLTVSPAANSKNVSPGNPVTVTATGNASVTSVTLAAGSATVAGTLASDGHSWTSTGKLKFGTKYTLKVETTGLTNNSTTSTFTTVTPSRTVTATFAANPFNLLKDGGTYGVGEPIIINFNHSIPAADQDAVVKALQVDVTPTPVDGRWHWVGNNSVHYRGENYWAAQSTITVHANLYGVKMGDGVYGANSSNVTIHIGDSHVLIADNKSHYMKVYVNGQMVRNIPVSMGRGGSTIGDKGQTVDFWTRNGPHVVLFKTPTHYMASDTFGISDPKSPFYYPPVLIHDTVRISDSGEFVHMADWNIPDQGKRNTSHGCINVGPKNALWVYNLLISGDIVDVVNSPIELPIWDGVGDWTVPWSKW